MNPARVIASDRRNARSLLLLSGSPSEKRLPSITLTTPGAISSLAGYTTEPMMRSFSMLAAMLPSGSTMVTGRPSCSPPSRWKYHQGMPFCIVTTAVSGPKSPRMSRATWATWCAFSVSST